MNTMTTMNDIAQVCCLGFSRFFFSRISLLLLTRTLLHQSEKHFDKKEKILVIWGGAFNKRRDFETTRFSFSFLLRTRREKKDTFETKRIISSSSEESARFERTQTHARTQNQRERKKDDAFFFFYILCSYYLRGPQRERKREDILSSRL